MLLWVVLILVVLWAAGLISGVVLNGLIHALLIGAVCVPVIWAARGSGRNTPPGGGIGRGEI